MNPILTVEFNAKIDDSSIKEESVPIHTPEELLNFIKPGGDCESIPDDADEVRIIFLPPEHPNQHNPIADLPTTMQIGIVFINGPLSEVAATVEQILDKAGRDELSSSFMKIIGLG